MPLQSLEGLSPQDRVTYRRWVGGVLATYGTILMLFVAFITYQAMVAPTQTQSAAAKSSDIVDRMSVRHAVKYD